MPDIRQGLNRIRNIGNGVVSMWRRIQAACFILLAILVSGVWFSTSSQDNYAERLEDLEVRVTLLEATVAAFSAQEVPAATPVAEAFVIQGSFTLRGTRGDDYVMSGGECYGLGGFDDLYPGAQVRVTGAGGELLGLGDLEDDPDSRRCDFVFSVEVPRSAFYSVAAGHASRQGPSYTFDEMVENNWEVSLVLG